MEDYDLPLLCDQYQPAFHQFSGSDVAQEEEEQEAILVVRPLPGPAAAAKRALQLRVVRDAARGDPHDRIPRQGPRAAAQAQERLLHPPGRRHHRSAKPQVEGL